jgi:UDP-N-acetylglucosamine transferase subunit ALG13
MPIIQFFTDAGHNVILASDGDAKAFLEAEYPNLPMEELPSYGITYPKKGNFILHMSLQIPGILSAIKKEKQVLTQLIDKYELNVVVSDNRYGMWHEAIKSVFVSHQLRVASPIAENLLVDLQQKYTQHFDEVWVPDVAGQTNLSGKLSHGIPTKNKLVYLGALSRFNLTMEAVSPQNLQPESEFVLAIVSGPEPQRTAFERLLFEEAKKYSGQMVIVGGKPNGDEIKTSNNITHYPFLQSAQMKWLIQNSKVVISRSGYSSIMDYVSLNKRAILIPTPGQTEQEYLVKHLAYSSNFMSYNQNEFKLNTALEEFDKMSRKEVFKSVDYFNNLASLINTI